MWEPQIYSLNTQHCLEWSRLPTPFCRSKPPHVPVPSGVSFPEFYTDYSYISCKTHLRVTSSRQYSQNRQAGEADGTQEQDPEHSSNPSSATKHTM